MSTTDEDDTYDDMIDDDSQSNSSENDKDSHENKAKTARLQRTETQKQQLEISKLTQRKTLQTEQRELRVAEDRWFRKRTNFLYNIQEMENVFKKYNKLSVTDFKILDNLEYVLFWDGGHPKKRKFNHNLPPKLKNELKRHRVHNVQQKYSHAYHYSRAISNLNECHPLNFRQDLQTFCNLGGFLSLSRDGHFVYIPLNKRKPYMENQDIFARFTHRNVYQRPYPGKNYRKMPIKQWNDRVSRDFKEDNTEIRMCVDIADFILENCPRMHQMDIFTKIYDDLKGFEDDGSEDEVKADVEAEEKKQELPSTVLFVLF